MDKLTPPFFVIEGRDIMVFTSLKDIQFQLEPIDVGKGVYVAYDAHGRLLRLETDGRHVSVFLVEEEPRHADELETSLREFLKSMNEPKAGDSTCDLPCLVEASRKFVVSHRSWKNFIDTSRNLIRAFWKRK